MGKKFDEQMICCCNLSRKWWWGSIHVFDSPIKFLNYLDKEGSIDFDSTNIEKVTVAYLCNRVGDDGGEWEGTDSHWAVCNPTDKGAFAVWEINLSDFLNPTPASVPLPPDELLTERDLQEFIEGTLVLAYMEGQANSNASATKLAKEIIAKCRQSEAAEIEKLKEKCHHWQEMYIEDVKPLEMVEAMLDEARVDQNRKIGEAIDETENPYKSKGVWSGKDYHGTDYGVFEIARQSFKEELAKLQKGEVSNARNKTDPS